MKMNTLNNLKQELMDNGYTEKEAFVGACMAAATLAKMTGNEEGVQYFMERMKAE